MTAPDPKPVAHDRQNERQVPPDPVVYDRRIERLLTPEAAIRLSGSSIGTAYDRNWVDSCRPRKIAGEMLINR